MKIISTKSAIEKAGGMRQLAGLLNVTPPAIHQWGEYPPELRQYQLIVLKADWFLPPELQDAPPGAPPP
jgi:hypothetical protein